MFAYKHKEPCLRINTKQKSRLQYLAFREKRSQNRYVHPATNNATLTATNHATLTATALLLTITLLLTSNCPTKNVTKNIPSANQTIGYHLCFKLILDQLMFIHDEDSYNEDNLHQPPMTLLQQRCLYSLPISPSARANISLCRPSQHRFLQSQLLILNSLQSSPPVQIKQYRLKTIFSPYAD